MELARALSELDKLKYELDKHRPLAAERKTTLEKSSDIELPYSDYPDKKRLRL